MMGWREWTRELRSATRALRRTPTFAGFAVATLGLGVAATTTVFTIVDRVVLRPLPYPDSDRLVVVGSEFRHDPGGLGPLSVAQINDLVAEPGPAEVVVGVTATPKTISGLGDPERMPVNQIGSGFFELLGARPAVGRLVDDSDQEAGAERAVVIDYTFWQERFGGSSDALGRVVRIDDEPYEIVGVLERDFVRPESLAGNGPLWIAARFPLGDTSRGAFSISAAALLPEGVGAEAFETFATARFLELHDFLAGSTVRGFREHVVGDIGSRLRGAIAAVVLLMLISCVNVASLTITRAQRRARELSVRAALGAGRGRLARQLGAESFIIAIAGGALGAVAAFWSVELFRAHAPAGIPRLAEVGADGSALLFVIVLSLLTLLLFGTVPALHAAVRAESGLARDGLRSTGRRAVTRARTALVLVETALAVVLVVGSGLLANDLIRLTAEDRGFRAAELTTARVDLRGRIETSDEASAFWKRLTDEARRLPGVTDVAFSTQLPYDGVSAMHSVTPQGLSGDDDEVFVTTVAASAGYFKILDIPVLEGRPMNPAESETAARVVVVNQAFVEEYWPGEAPLGRVIAWDGGMQEEPLLRTVVGVVGDVRTRPGSAAPPQIFLPAGASPPERGELVVATDGTTVAAELRALLRRMDPGLPIGRIERLSSITSGTLDRPRFYASLFGGFAMVALLLAIVGVYGTTAYAMRSRTREIGIRLALGAARSLVVRSAVTAAAGVLLAGVVVGLAAAALAARTVEDVLVYVGPHDASTYGIVGTLILAAGALAAWVPAHRSSRIDPAITLREE